jgi:hypothetical protein
MKIMLVMKAAYQIQKTLMINHSQNILKKIIQIKKKFQILNLKN